MQIIDSELFLAAIAKTSSFVNENIFWFVSLIAVVIVGQELWIFIKKTKRKN